MLIMQEVLASYQEVRSIYTALDINFPKSRNLEEITKLNRLFSCMNCGYYFDEIWKTKLLLQWVSRTASFLTVLPYDQQLLEVELFLLIQ